MPMDQEEEEEKREEEEERGGRRKKKTEDEGGQAPPSFPGYVCHYPCVSATRPLHPFLPIWNLSKKKLYMEMGLPV